MWDHQTSSSPDTYQIAGGTNCGIIGGKVSFERSSERSQWVNAGGMTKLRQRTTSFADKYSTSNLPSHALRYPTPERHREAP